MTHKDVKMAIENTYERVLILAIEQAKLLVESSDPLKAIDKYVEQNLVFKHYIKTKHNEQIITSEIQIGQAVLTIINNLNQSKYLFSILITGLVEKIVNPNQDITRTQKGLTKWLL